MLPFIALAGAALYALDQASPEKRQERQINAYREGRISRKEAERNIQKIWIGNDDFSDLERDQANWNAYVKKRQEEQKQFQSLDADGKYAFMSDRVKADFSLGKIDRDTASQRLAQLKEWRRNN